MMHPGMGHPGMGMRHPGMGLMGHPGMGMRHPGMGMMGHPGMGMRGLGWRLNALDLTNEQREKIKSIFIETTKKHLELMGALWDEQAKLQALYGGEQLDPKAIGEVYGRIFDVKRQMIESMIAAHNQRRSVLTEEQRNKLKQFPGWGRRGAMGQHGMGYPGRMMR